MNQRPSATATVTAVHDLNNKIGVILARCELLEQHCQLGTRATSDLETIRKAAEGPRYNGEATIRFKRRAIVIGQWLGLGVFLLGLGVGARLTLITQQGMKNRLSGKR